jgi:fibronectin-binding autotransporter adhesin
MKNLKNTIAAVAALIGPAGALGQNVCPPMPAPTVTLNVDSTADGLNSGACAHQVSGRCTLREAIQEANATVGAEVILPRGTYTLTIPPASSDDNTTGDLNIVSSMTLSEQPDVVIQAGTTRSSAIDRVLHISSSGQVVLSGITIRFGKTNNSSGFSTQGGGGILFDGYGALCLTQDRIIQNAATNQTYGGGISDIGFGTLYLDGVDVAGNVAGNAGGGIEAFQSGAVYIQRSSIALNTAALTGTGGGIDANGFPGVGSSDIELTDSTVAKNTAHGLWGGGISVWGDNLVIHGGSIEANHLSAGGSGAGVFVAGTSDVDITGAVIRKNVNGAAGGTGFTQGGGAAFFTSGSITLKKDEISDNRVLAGNLGQIIEADGGGVYVSGASTVWISDSMIRRNSANAGAAANKSFGGGIVLMGGASALIEESQVSGNSTTYDAGGIYDLGGTLTLRAVGVEANTASVSGGGVMMEGGSFLVTDSEILKNRSGTVAIPGGYQGGGGALFGESATGSVQRSRFSGNSAQNAGGLWIDSGASASLDEITVSGNVALNPTWGTGGGIHAQGSQLILSSSTVSGNSGLQGAGIFLNSAGTLTNVTIANNRPGAGLESVRSGAGQVSFTTISGNAIGIWPAGFIGQLSLFGTIVAGNQRDCQFPGLIVYLGYDLIGSQAQCGLGVYGQYPPGSGQYAYSGPGVIFNVNPMLGPLQNNGGATLTMALLPGSPAIDAVAPNVCPPPIVDQRGITRPQANSCDIGAFEAN